MSRHSRRHRKKQKNKKNSYNIQNQTGKKRKVKSNPKTNVSQLEYIFGGEFGKRLWHQK